MSQMRETSNFDSREKKTVENEFLVMDFPYSALCSMRPASIECFLALIVVIINAFLQKAVAKAFTERLSTHAHRHTHTRTRFLMTKTRLLKDHLLPHTMKKITSCRILRRSRTRAAKSSVQLRDELSFLETARRDAT